MAKGTFGEVVRRAISDASFRRQLQSDPNGALKGFDLTGDERAALRSGDASKLSALGIDQRMSKAFTLGDAASSFSRASGGDLSRGTSAITDGGAPSAQGAIIDEAGGPEGALNQYSRISDAGGSVREGITSDATGGRAAIGDNADGSVRAGVTSEATGGRNALGDQHDGARSAIGDNAGGERAAVDGSGNTSREGTAYITADESGNDAVAGGTVASWKSAPIDGGAEGEAASLASSDSSATSAFMTADEMGNDVASSSIDGSASSATSAYLTADEAGHDALGSSDTASTDAWTENPEHQG